MGKIIVYEHAYYKGKSREFTKNVADLDTTGLDEGVSSIKVIGSVWVAYEHSQYKGRQFILEEREYPEWKHWGGLNDSISSLKEVEMAIGDPPLITLYGDANYGGKSATFTSKVDSLTNFSFKEAVSSIKVKSGVWILYDHAHYYDLHYVLKEGVYPTAEAWTGKDNKVASLRPVKEPYYPTELLSMEFDIDAAVLKSTPTALVNLSQRNDSSREQGASWSTTRTVTTTNTYEWGWDNCTAVSLETTFSTGVPCIASGEISVGVENTFAVGESRGEENTQSEEWNFSVPAVVAAKTHLRVQVNILQGKMNVPFTAIMKKGPKRWTETGMYKGTQSYDLNVDYKETPL